MIDDFASVKYVSDSTGAGSIDFWTSESGFAAIPEAEKYVGGGQTEAVKCSKKARIPAALDEWVERRMYCHPGITIKILASQIGINFSYLSQYFNSTLGVNFQHWLHTHRIEEAKRIIAADPGIKFFEVAQAVGIPERYNFSRWFRQITGITANDWRARCRTNASGLPSLIP